MTNGNLVDWFKHRFLGQKPPATPAYPRPVSVVQVLSSYGPGGSREVVRVEHAGHLMNSLPENNIPLISRPAIVPSSGHGLVSSSEHAKAKDRGSLVGGK